MAESPYDLRYWREQESGPQVTTTKEPFHDCLFILERLDYVTLHNRVGLGGVERLGGPSQPVNAGDDDVPHAICTVEDSQLVMNALGMLSGQRSVRTGGIVHAVQCTSGALNEKVRSAGLVSSFRSSGDALDKSMVESFWSGMRN